jgi:hypothetical protein
VFWGLLFNVQKGFSCIIQLHSRKFQDLAFWTSKSFYLYASEVLVMEQAQTETENTTISIADLASVNYLQCGKSAIHPTVATEIYCLTQMTFFT